MIENDPIFNKVKDMFPDAPDFFIKAMYHNIKGKQHLWTENTMNDNSIPEGE